MLCNIRENRMSIPRNHHFVSQIHIKNFFNEELNEIFIYDKVLDNHYSKKTSKSLFSEKDLNTKVKDGKKDFESLERDLNIYFEKDFKANSEIIQDFISDLEYSEKVNNALYYFAKYGAIGEIRNPRHKPTFEDAISKVFDELLTNCTPELENQFEDAFAYKKDTNYINSVQYSKFANEIVELMGDIIFRIETPKDENDFFLLPDFCAANVREKINEYFNPDVKEIAYIGLPLTSKIYIHFYSSKMKNIKIKSDIVLIDSEKVFNLNKINLEYCESKVACENKNYLIEFVNNVAQHGV